MVNGFEETVKLLLAKGAKVNAICLDVRKPRSDVAPPVWHCKQVAAASKTPLMLACGLAAPPEDPTLPIRVIRLLLESGANVNIKDAEEGGMTAVHYAACSRDPRILELHVVIDDVADSKALNELGRTAVHHLVCLASEPPPQ